MTSEARRSGEASARVDEKADQVVALATALHCAGDDRKNGRLGSTSVSITDPTTSRTGSLPGRSPGRSGSPARGCDAASIGASWPLSASGN
jgi:hypothetical protein